MHGRGGLWAVVLIAFIVAAAGPCRGQGRTVPGLGSSEDASDHHQRQLQQLQAVPARLLAAAGAVPSSKAAAAEGQASLNAAGLSNVLDSSRLQKLLQRGCGHRFCGPKTVAAYPKK